jgi:hypothetical protein
MANEPILLGRATFQPIRQVARNAMLSLEN